MKKIKGINQLKNDNIMLSSYAVVDLVEYNDILYKSIRASSTWNRMYSIIYDSTLSKQKKYEKLKDILIGK